MRVCLGLKLIENPNGTHSLHAYYADLHVAGTLLAITGGQWEAVTTVMREMDLPDIANGETIGRNEFKSVI